MDHLKDERYRGSIGDLRAFQKPRLDALKRFIREDLPDGTAGAEGTGA